MYKNIYFKQNACLLPLPIKKICVAELGLESQDNLWLILHARDTLK